MNETSYRPRGPRLGTLLAFLALAGADATAQQQLQQQPADQALQQFQGPPRPSASDQSGAPIEANWTNAPLNTVVEAIGARTGLNFEYDPALANERITIVGHEPIPGALAYQLLESILATRNYTMLPTLDGHLVKIERHAAGQHGDRVEIRVGTEVPPEGYDTIGIHIVRVQYANAQEMATLLKVAGSANNNISVYQLTNTLIIMDTADGLRNMFKVLKELDIPGGETLLEIFYLDYARAEAIITQIETVLGTADPAAAAAGGVQRPQTQIRQPTVRARTTTVPGQAEPEVVGSNEQTLRLVAEERLNAIIAVATAGLMDQVRFLVEQLDSEIPYEQDTMHYIELLNAEAEEVETALTAITGGTPRQAGGGARAAGAGGQGGGGGGGGQGGEVQPFEKSVTITRYDPTNALLIIASPQDARRLRNMIANLDKPRRQVSVEAIIMEVTINDRFQYSAETAGLSANDAFALNNVVRLANAITAGPFAVAGLGTTIGVLNGTTEIPVPTGVDPDTGQPTGLELQTIPNVPLLWSMLETITDVEVLSQPNLMTVDGEEASIIVGQEVPILNSLSDVDDRTGFRSRGSISREKVGVQMTVEPQINEGDYVNLNVTVEVSEPVESTVGIDPNEVGATFSVTEVDSNVVVGDGQTGVIGGLLREGKNRTVNQPPVLGDLPVIGFLFRNKVAARTKQNLVILLTPHIVKEGDDLSRVSDFRLQEFYEQKLDTIFEEGGFIKKIENKNYKRNKYSPTEKFNVDGHFQRGTINKR